MPDRTVRLDVTVRIPQEVGAGAGVAAARLVAACRRAGVDVTVERAQACDGPPASSVAEVLDELARAAERKRLRG